MARVNHAKPEGASQNPTKKYLSWKSNDKSFSYYDKELGENVEVPLPMKFVFLQHYHTVKGWNDASASGIWANEVYYIGSEEMTVRAFKGGEIASGIYKEIKGRVNAAGGKYHRSIYVALEDGTLANISIKGAVVKEWSDFFDQNKNLIDNQWVEVNEAKDEKKGSIKYSVPSFSLGSTLDKKGISNADIAAEELRVHMESYFSKDDSNEDVDEEEFSSEELAF